MKEKKVKMVENLLVLFFAKSNYFFDFCTIET